MTFCLQLPLWSQVVGQWLYEWQTLVGAILALVAAYWAGRGLNKQIKQAENFKVEDLRQRHAAARCVLPLALASIGEVCDFVAKQVTLAIDDLDDPDFNQAFDHFEAGRNEQIEFTRASVPEEAISAIGQFVETLKDNDNVRHVAELVSSLQILIARYNSFSFRDTAPVDGLYGLLLDTAKVKALTSAMFNYGRFVDEDDFAMLGKISISDAWDLIRKEAVGLVFLHRNLDRYANRLNTRVEGFKASEVSPWNEKFEY